MPHCWPDVTKPNITQRTPTHSLLIHPTSLSSLALCFLANHGTVDNGLGIFAVPVPLRIEAGGHGMWHGAQQGVTVSVIDQHQLLLLVVNKAAAASQRPTAHLQYLE